ncbi:MAG: RluA family pseudouridine synthase, partial [Clostridia bacterium]|nr:RluA family pseudouridine synthase [Clostridia bacterium]
MKEFLVGPNDAGQRVDRFVLKVTVGLPKSLLYKAIRMKKIKVNRKRCEIGQHLSEGDSVQMFLSPDFFGEKEDRFLTLTPQITPVWEDENLLICDKPVGLSCHADEKQETGTLIDHIKAYLYQKGEYCPENENSFAPALCNRIDRNTSGLVIAA